jgi:exopolysaccharide biosynthesis polyprenyl glycosylphosphotransferase
VDLASWYSAAKTPISFQDTTKRISDLIIAFGLLVFTLPLLVIVAVAVKLDSCGPVLYRQERVGLNGRKFILLKFRTMVCDAEPHGPVWATENDARITRFGRFLRYTRIDELPQLINVLRGDMSMVGPRPERPYFTDRIAAVVPFFTERHRVKPGITGLAQINYPYGASIADAQQKLRYDLYYIEHRSFLFDLFILVLTLGVVFSRWGAR